MAWDYAYLRNRERAQQFAQELLALDHQQMANKLSFLEPIKTLCSQAKQLRAAIAATASQHQVLLLSSHPVEGHEVDGQGADKEAQTVKAANTFNALMAAAAASARTRKTSSTLTLPSKSASVTATWSTSRTLSLSITTFVASRKRASSAGESASCGSSSQKCWTSIRVPTSSGGPIGIAAQHDKQ